MPFYYFFRWLAATFELIVAKALQGFISLRKYDTGYSKKV